MPQRMSVYKLREDRADVIVPALLIYINVMRWADAEEIFVPKIGLADGLIHTLYEEVKLKEIEIWQTPGFNSGYQPHMSRVDD